MTASLGFSQFFLDHSTREQGNSYTTLPPLMLLTAVQSAWDQRTPGMGETNLDRKVVVPLQPSFIKGQPVFFCQPRIKPVLGMPVHAHVVARQKGEDPYVEVYITPEEASKYDYIEIPATKIGVVCYSAEALLENGGSRTGSCDWEIVTILCSEDEDGERMTPLTMARNQLEMAGGTKPEKPYTSEEWALAVWKNAQKGVKVRPHPKTN